MMRGSVDTRVRTASLALALVLSNRNSIEAVKNMLMKVANSHGGWAVILRLTDRKGDPLPGLSYFAP